MCTSVHSPSLKWSKIGSQGRKTQRQELKHRTQEYYILPNCQVHFQFLYTTQYHLPKGEGAPHIMLGPPGEIIEKIPAPPDLPTGQINEGISSAEGPSFKMTLAHLKLMKDCPVHNVLNMLMVLYWATFITLFTYREPTGHSLTWLNHFLWFGSQGS